jgi:solute carrier family 25 phosphate transporter 23/24/25/41
MNISDVVSELKLELQETQNQRDKRVEALWQRLDPQKTGELDLKGLKRGFQRIDHRETRLDSFSSSKHAVTTYSPRSSRL